MSHTTESEVQTPSGGDEQRPLGEQDAPSNHPVQPPADGRVAGEPATAETGQNDDGYVAI